MKKIKYVIFFALIFNKSIFGQEMVKDIKIGTQSSFPDNLVDVNGTLFFTASDNNHGVELWKSDGTEEGTVMVKDINLGEGSSTPRFLTNVAGTLYFSAYTSNDEDELWKSDGTAIGTVIVRDINPNSGSFGGSYPHNLIDVNGTLFFTATSTFEMGIELWKSDGTENGTMMVKNIYEDFGSSSEPTDFFNMNGVLYFSAKQLSGRNVWRSDGTDAGTFLLKDICNYTNRPWSGQPYFRKVNDVLYFIPISNISNTAGSELWKSDGTETGTTMVANIRIGEQGADVYIEGTNNLLFFRAVDEVHGTELWKSDGTLGGTTIVKDILDGSESSSPSDLIEYNGEIYFSARTISGRKLVKSDGSENGTLVVSEDFINPGNFIVFNDLLYTAALSLSDFNYYTWNFDATNSITSMHPNENLDYGLVNVFNNSETPASAVVGNTLFFSSTKGGLGNELWKFDASVAGLNSINAPKLSNFYPNPTSEFFTIENKAIKMDQIRCFDTNGKLIFESTLNNANQNLLQVDSKNWNNGVYVIEIKTEKGLLHEKLLKK